MTTTDSLTLAAPTQHLRQLSIIRSFLLCCLWASFALSLLSKNTALPHHHILLILFLFSAIYGLTFIRLRNPLAVTENEFFIQLLIDVLLLNALFYFSGGANNPFISYFLVPICISSATLPWRYTWTITAICVTTYTWQLFYHIPLPIFSIDHQQHSELNFHIIGMWFNFFISAILITYFVVKMANTLRQNNELLNNLKEDELRNEQLIAVATLAAGAAHEMNTPLSTMTVLLSELRNDHKDNKSLLSDIELLSQQVSYCASSLKQLVQNANEATQGQFKQQPLKSYCLSILDRWQLLQPTVNVHLSMNDTNFNPTIEFDHRIDHAILNLLTNAADASPEYVEIIIHWSEKNLNWKIIDQGNGIAQHLQNTLGKELGTTKKQGLGLGLLLTHATIKRFGGSVTQSSNLPQGTITDLIIPLNLMQ